MATLSLREAAEQVGVSKSTIFRAIRAGRMSAAKDDDGNFLIDPAELFRVYPPKGSQDDVAGDVPVRAETRPVGQDAPAPEAVELRIRNAELEAQLNALKTILETEKERTQELKAERDKWAEQAQRLALTGPQPRRGLFGWLKRA
jgi:excisionase family DNA binding protein